MDEPVRLSPVVQGVEFTVRDADRRTVRALILRDALEGGLGAGPSPQSWLRTYAMHADLIGTAALLQHRRQPAPAFVVLQASLLLPHSLHRSAAPL